MRNIVIARKPILVTGAPRSGTSLVSGLLATAGAWVGSTVPGGPANPKGFFENIELRENIVKKILRSADVDTLGVQSLPDSRTHLHYPNLAAHVLQIIHRQGYTGNGPWLFKDAKLLLQWPLWRKAFPDARWVLVRRTAEDIVNSCLRTDFMRQHSSDRDFWRAWVSHYEAAIESLKQSPVWYREIMPSDIVAGERQGLQTLIAELGELAYQEQEITAFISREDWHAET